MSLRTIESKKLSSGKRKQSRNWSYYRKRRYVNKKYVGSTLSRGKYFSVFRDERKVLKILSTSPPENPVTHGIKRKDRTLVHRLYYRTLPVLFSRLQFPKDREVLFDLERFYYGWLNIANLSRGVTARVNRLSPELRYYTNQLESLQFQAKLY